MYYSVTTNVNTSAEATIHSSTTTVSETAIQEQFAGVTLTGSDTPLSDLFQPKRTLCKYKILVLIHVYVGVLHLLTLEATVLQVFRIMSLKWQWSNIIAIRFALTHIQIFRSGYFMTIILVHFIEKKTTITNC